MNASLTAIPGLRVGHWTDLRARTGCTVILCPAAGAVASASFLGPSPGSREGVLLAPEKRVERIHALLFTGGSAFGLGAATGVVRFLEERGVGHPTPVRPVPIVPAAVIFDLGVGDARAYPREEHGYAAAQEASDAPVQGGLIGAGTGATAGKFLGMERAAPGGLGNALVEQVGVRVAALAVVNPVGSVLDLTGRPLAGPDLDLTGRDPAQPAPDSLNAVTNTTLVAVATAHALGKAEARRLADAAQTALARVIRPSHTPFDGDSAFVLSTGEAQAADPLLLSALTQEAVARAVVDAVRASAD